MLYFTYRSDFRILATWLSTATTEARLEHGSCLFGVWSEHLDPRILNLTVILTVDTHYALTQPQPHFGRLQMARTLGRPLDILELVLDNPVLFCVTPCIHYECRPWEQSETGNRIIVVLLQVISLISPISCINALVYTSLLMEQRTPIRLCCVNEAFILSSNAG